MSIMSQCYARKPESMTQSVMETGLGCCGHVVSRGSEVSVLGGSNSMYEVEGRRVQDFSFA